MGWAHHGWADIGPKQIGLRSTEKIWAKINPKKGLGRCWPNRSFSKRDWVGPNPTILVWFGPETMGSLLFTWIVESELRNEEEEKEEKEGEGKLTYRWGQCGCWGWLTVALLWRRRGKLAERKGTAPRGKGSHSYWRSLVWQNECRKKGFSLCLRPLLSLFCLSILFFCSFFVYLSSISFVFFFSQFFFLSSFFHPSAPSNEGVFIKGRGSLCHPTLVQSCWRGEVARWPLCSCPQGLSPLPFLSQW